jgi:hypothetical protein
LETGVSSGRRDVSPKRINRGRGNHLTSASSELAAWSYGLAGLIFSAFAIRLWALGYARAPRSLTSTSLVAAATCSASWALCGLADFYSNDVAYRGVATVADIARYACWDACLLSFLGQEGQTRLGGRWRWRRS